MKQLDKLEMEQRQIEAQLQQLQHQSQRLDNREQYLTSRKEKPARTIDPYTAQCMMVAYVLTDEEFDALMSRILDMEPVREAIAQAVRNHDAYVPANMDVWHSTISM